jgi:hypothetical protein
MAAQMLSFTRLCDFVMTQLATLSHADGAPISAGLCLNTPTHGCVQVLAAHEAEWSERWERGSLEAEGDLHLAQALNASL